MLYREIIAVCSQIHTKHIKTLCRQTVEYSNVKADGTYSYHWTSLQLDFHKTPFGQVILVLFEFVRHVDN